MRALVLMPSFPVPAHSGAQMRNAALVRALGQDHEIDVLAFGSANDTQGPELPGARRVTLVAPPAARNRAARAANLVSRHWPDMALRLWSDAFADRVDHRPYDVVQAEGIEMGRYLATVPPVKRVYDAHNAEFLLQQRFAESGTQAVGRLYSRLQWHRLEAFERALVRTSRLTLAVSTHDANQLRALAGGLANVRVVPNVIDVASYPFEPRAPRETSPAGAEMLFVGKLDFRPNAEGVRWFIEQVLPRIGGRLFAVGAAPPEWLVRAGQHTERIAVTGYVADERPYLKRCTVLVLPLWAGGGSRLKALVALASGIPIVSTGLGMEGLEVEPGMHYLRAETADEWVACLRKLIDDPCLPTRLAEAGRRLVEERYDWQVAHARVREVYDWTV